MGVKDALGQARRLKEGKAQEHRVRRAHPDRGVEVRRRGDGPNQHRVDAHADHQEKALDAQGRQPTQVVGPDVAPLPVGEGGQRHRPHRDGEVDFQHPAVENDRDAQGHDFHGKAHDPRLHHQQQELSNLHLLHCLRQAPQGRADVYTRVAGDDPRALLDDILGHVENGHCDVECVGDDHSRQKRLEHPFEEHPGVQVVQAVLVYHHADELVPQHKGDYHGRYGDDDRLAQVPYHRENAGVPGLRRSPDLGGYGGDLIIHVTEHIRQVPRDAGDEKV